MSFREFECGPEMPEPPLQPWYLAYTRGRMEETALFNLQRQGFDAYLPMFKTWRQTGEGIQVRHEVLFPRYVFFRATSEHQSLFAVSSTRGVRSLVRSGAEPAQVALELVQEIRKFEHARNQADLEAISPIQPGARVRMRKGELRGLEGLVVSVGKKRVTFLLELLGRQKQVTVEHRELELA